MGWGKKQIRVRPQYRSWPVGCWGQVRWWMTRHCREDEIADNAAYLESLEKAGWLTMSVLPAEQPDPIFRGINLS